MLFMRVGIYAGAIGGLLAAAVSIEAGVALEMATIRGLAVFLALTMAGYVADLVVVTTPPALLSDAYDGDEYDEDEADAEVDRADDDRTPTSIAAPGARTAAAAAPDRRAA